MPGRNEVVLGSVALIPVLGIPLHWPFLVEAGDDVIALDSDTIFSLVSGAAGSSRLCFRRGVSCRDFFLRRLEIIGRAGVEAHPPMSVVEGVETCR